MPCYTPPPTEEEMNSWGQLSEGQMEALICGLIRAGSDPETVFHHLDWDEIGVEREVVETWWAKHQEKDRRRAAGL